MGDYRSRDTDPEHVVVERPNSGAEFWNRYLQDLDATQYPRLPGPNCRPRPAATIGATFDGLGWESSAFLPGTFLHLAWAIIQARATGLADAAFVTKRGHSGLMAPSRIRIDRESKVFDVLTAIQNSAGDIDKHEHHGLEAIKAINRCPDTPELFQTMLGFHSQRSSSVTSFKTIQRQKAIEEAMFTLIIDCTISLSSLSIHLRHDPTVILHDQARRLTSQIDHVLRQVLAEPQATLGDISIASEYDIDDIWRWNSEMPESRNICIHQTFMDFVMEQPDALALDAWDGKMTYNEMDQRSEQLAHQLVDLGVRLGSRVPVCFEKSIWSNVAALSIMKAGGACVAMGMECPLPWLESIISQVTPSVVICSNAMRSKVEQLHQGSILAIDAAWFQTPRVHSSRALPIVKASDLAFINFISSSTGRPKGVMISHNNVSSWVHHWKDVLCASPASRVYDASSPDSDFFWMDFTVAFGTGGCLCIPSSGETKTNVETSIDRYAVTLLHLNSYEARNVDFAAAPRLQTILSTGESVTKLDLPPHLRLLSGYGPAECTMPVICAGQGQLQVNDHSIGQQFGINAWVVSSAGDLCGVGEVGELWLEGPTIGLGYFENPEKTATSFVSDPDFIARGATGHAGRNSRLYRTGDMVWQQADGSLIYVGRNDNQVLVRGHRVDLGEIEHHLRELLGSEEVTQVVVDLSTAQGEVTSTLLAFIQPTGSFTEAERELQVRVKKLTNNIPEKLRQQLPSHMVPSSYIACASIPRTASGSADRRKLREKINHKARKEVDTAHQNGTICKENSAEPLSVLETQLCQLWCEVLGIKNRSTITTESNFLSLGGNSLAAFRLKIAAQSWGLVVTIADIFQHPTLADMAEHVRYAHGAPSAANVELTTTHPHRFSAALALYPLTSSQRCNLAGPLESIAKENDYLTFDIPPSLFVSDMAQIVDSLAQHYDVLRTILVQIQDQIFQPVLSSSPSHAVMEVVEGKGAEASDFRQMLESIIKSDLEVAPKLGNIWFKAYLFQLTDRKKLVLRIHRAFMDATSIDMLSQSLSDLCAGRPLPPSATSWRLSLEQQASAEMRFCVSPLAES